MPYALFSNDAKLSKAYPTEADVWAMARRSGLVVDVLAENADRLQGLLAARVGPAGAKLVQQPLVASFEFRSRQCAGANHSRPQIAITERHGERRFAREHRLALAEPLAHRGVGTVA